MKPKRSRDSRINLHIRDILYCELTAFFKNLTEEWLVDKHILQNKADIMSELIMIIYAGNS